MFLFPFLSFVAFFSYLEFLLELSNANVESFVESFGGMVGYIIDFPVIIVVLISVKLRSAPLSVLLTAAVVIATAAIVKYNMVDVRVYIVNAIIGYSFVCIFVNRVYSHIKKLDVSDNIADSIWLYNEIGIVPVNWRWTRRLNSFVNKASRVLSIVSFFVLFASVFIILGNAGKSGGLVQMLFAPVIGYTLFWLAYFSFIVTPILLVERIAKLANSLNNYGDGSTISRGIKGISSKSKEKVLGVSEKTKS